MRTTLNGIAGIACLAAAMSGHSATNVIDFESPLPGGLVAATHSHLAPVPSGAIVSTQYVGLGLIMHGAALENLGSGHASSGVNSIGGMDSQGRFNSGASITITFVSPADGTTPATTDFFSVMPDLLNNSDNSTVVSGYAVDGTLLGSATYQETGSITPAFPILLRNIGRIHRVVISPTLHDAALGGGGIQFDLLTFTTVRPEPVLSIRVSQVELCWESTPTNTYQVQFRSSLTTNQWVNLGGLVQGNGSRQCLPDYVPEGEPHRFYRLLVAP